MFIVRRGSGVKCIKNVYINIKYRYLLKDNNMTSIYKFNFCGKCGILEYIYCLILNNFCFCRCITKLRRFNKYNNIGVFGLTYFIVIIVSRPFRIKLNLKYTSLQILW